MKIHKLTWGIILSDNVLSNDYDTEYIFEDIKLELKLIISLDR